VPARPLVALDRPSQRGEQQIAEVTQHTEAAVTSAPAEGDAEARAVLAERLEQAQQAKADEDTASPDMVRPHERSRSSAPGGTGTQDGSAG
jgi:hypothetical protein